MVLVIVFILSMIVLNTFSNYKNNQAFNNDLEQIMAVLRTAKNQTLSSKNATQYGVHFSSSEVVLFAGASYVLNDPTNQIFPFSSEDTSVTLNLTLGGSDILFNRLTGEVTNDGTITVSSSKLSKTKIITVHKTGVIES